MSKINVMHILRPATGGMKGHVLNLIENLNIREFNSILVCPREVIDCSITKNYEIINLEIKGNISPQHDWRAIKQLSNLIEKNKIHILHTHGAKSAFLGRLAGRKSGVPIIVNTVHNFIYETSPIYLKYPLILVNRMLNSFTDMQITVSKALYEAILVQEKCNRNKIFTIYNGINLDDFNLIQDCNHLKMKLNIDLKSPVVGLISRLIKQKGVHYFLKAAQIILNENPQTKFLIAGDGPERKRLEEMAIRLRIKDNVMFLGYVQNISNLLPIVNVFVIPSLSEGLSISAIEAMACRRPIVAFAVGGLSEVVKNNKTGFLVDKGDYYSLAEKTIFLLKNRKIAEKFGFYARQVVEDKFCLAQMVAQTEILYEKLLKEKRIILPLQPTKNEELLQWDI